MKKTFFILGAAALILFQACQKEEAANGTAGDKQSVSANIILNATIEGAAEEGTKTTLGTENDIQYALWSKTDAVRTFDENGVYATMEIEAKDDFKPSTKATFIAKSVPGDFGEPVCAFYPASEGFNPGYADNVISFNLPATQYYKENSFDDNTNVAVSKIQNDEGKLNAKFMNVCGYLKLQLKGDFKVGKIKLMGHNGEKLNGAFTINTDVAEENMVAQATSTRTAGDDVITLDCGDDGVLLNSEQPTTFIFVVPVDAFAKGFTTVIYDSNNTYVCAVLGTNKGNKITRSIVKSMPSTKYQNKFIDATPTQVDKYPATLTGWKAVDLSEFTWSRKKETTGDKRQMFTGKFTTSMPGRKTTKELVGFDKAHTVTFNGYTANYTSVTNGTKWANGHICYSDETHADPKAPIVIVDNNSTYTSADKFKNAVTGQLLLYQLQTSDGSKWTFVQNVGPDGTTANDFGYLNKATGVYVKAKGASGTHK